MRGICSYRSFSLHALKCGVLTATPSRPARGKFLSVRVARPELAAASDDERWWQLGAKSFRWQACDTLEGEAG